MACPTWIDRPEICNGTARLAPIVFVIGFCRATCHWRAMFRQHPRGSSAAALEHDLLRLRSIGKRRTSSRYPQRRDTKARYGASRYSKCRQLEAFPRIGAAFLATSALPATGFPEVCESQQTSVVRLLYHFIAGAHKLGITNTNETQTEISDIVTLRSWLIAPPQ
jgi:hypothetical protein